MLLSRLSRLPYFEADKGKEGDPPPEGDPKGKKDDKPQTWDAIVESMSDDVKVLYNDNVKGLKSALDVERTTNKENAAKLKRLEELEVAEQKRKEAEMSETEKLQTQLEAQQSSYAELQAKIEQEREEFAGERIKSALKLAASAQGFADPNDAFNLADISEVSIDPESGEISGIEESLKKLAESKPYLLDKKKGDGLGTNTRRSGKFQKAPEPEKTYRPLKVRL